MATIVAISGAAGNFASGSAWVGGVAPTAADDAQVGAGTTSITINAGSVCRSLDFNGFAGTATHSAGVTIAIGDATAGASNIALRLASGMTYTLGSQTTSLISFISTSVTQQTITSATKTIGNYTINGAGSSYLLADANNVVSTVTLTAGTLNTGNQTCIWGTFQSDVSTTRSIIGGTSSITITGTSGQWNTLTTTGLTQSLTSSTITFSAAGGYMRSSGTFGTVIWSAAGAGAQCQGFTCSTLTITGVAAKTVTFSIAASITITGTLTITGNSATDRILVFGSVIGTARTISAASVSLSNVDFQDINAAGAAAPFSGTSMGNALGNTNITFDTPTTQTHTASAGGNWSDVTKWTSRVPLPQDNVVVDVNTTGTITADMPRLGADITFAGFLGTASFASVANSVYGSIVLGSGMTLSGTLTLTLSGRSSLTITSNGKQFPQPMTISAPGATYGFNSALSTAGTFSQGASSTLNTNGFSFTCLIFLTSTVGGTPITNWGSSTITLTDTTGAGTWILSHVGILNAGTSNVVIANASAVTRQVLVSGRTLATLTYTVAGSTGTLVLAASCTIGTLNFSDITNARTLQLTAGITVTITNAFNVNGTSGKLMSIQSVTAATHTLSKATGAISCDYVSITNSIAGGGATWYAGANSVNVSGNSGWIFNAPPAGRGGFLPFFG